MKIQYIAVIFVVIILPIAMVMSSYIGAQIDTITLQTEYTTKLTEATYDAIKAFQINTVNNRYSTVSDSKIRDIEASINTFYSSLSNNEYLSKEELQIYVPALVYTLYDGYYIYTKYDNMYPQKGGTIYTDTNDAEANFGLKPYIYYSCRYNNSYVDFVVNYTLDNAITIYGTAANGKYITKSGYLINPNYVTVKNYGDDPMKWSLTYSNNSDAPVTIGRELLLEHLLFSDETSGDYSYLTYNGQKIYYDQNSKEYFTYQNYTKQYITESRSNEDMLTYLEERTSIHYLYSTSAFEYYYNAKIFSEEVAELTKTVSQKNAIDLDGETIEFDVDTGFEKIFVANADNDPLMSDSIFNENRMQVIKKSIESNLVSAIANYNIYSSNSYEFSLPILQETDWEKITNNVSVISFLQGLPIGYKYYNNYCVLTNNSNEETVKKENIYIITENAGAREYHLAGCKHLIEDSTEKITATAYSNLSFLRQTVRKAENNYLWFYPQNMNGKTITACYNCIVNSTDVYSTDQILKGKITEKNIDTGQEELKYDTTNSRLKKIRELYIRALARERNDLYQANMNSINHEQNEYINEITDKNRVIITGKTHRMRKTETQQLTAEIWLGVIKAEWSSSNPNIVQVDENGKVTAIKEGTAIITAKYSGYNDGTYRITVVNEKVTKLVLDKTEIEMKAGEKEKISVIKIEPENATNKNVTWRSSDPSIATVDANGNVTAIKAGTVTIIAESEDGGASASCSVRVIQLATGITVSPSNIKLGIGETAILSPTIRPSNASDKSVKWSTNNSRIAVVDNKGKVTAKGLGKAIITVKTADGSNKTANCEVTVVQKATKLVLNATDIQLNINKTYTLVATITPTNTTNKQITWSSSNSSIATVDKNGKVTAKKIGTTTITAKTNDGSNLSASCEVKVVKLVTSISLNATNITLYKNETYDLSATVTPSDAIDKSVTWSSSDSNIATVDENGKITAKAIGEVTITAKTNDGSNLSASCKVTVKPRLITNLIIQPSSVTMMVGETVNLTVKVTPSNADNKAILWATSDSNIASIDQNGKLTAIKEGSVDAYAMTLDGSLIIAYGLIEVKPNLGLKIYNEGEYVRVDCSNYYMTYAFDDDHNKCDYTKMRR